MVGGRQAGPVQEREHPRPFMAQMLRQPAIRRGAVAGAEQPVELRFKLACGDPQAVRGHRTLRMPVPQHQAGLEQLLDGQGKSGRRGRGDERQLPTAPEQVAQTALMEGVLEPIVRGPPVVEQHSRIRGADQRERLRVAAPGLNGVHRHVRGDGHVQPLQPPAHLVCYGVE